MKIIYVVTNTWKKVMKEFALYSSGLIQELHFFFSVKGGNIIRRCMLHLVCYIYMRMYFAV